MFSEPKATALHCQVRASSHGMLLLHVLHLNTRGGLVNGPHTRALVSYWQQKLVDVLAHTELLSLKISALLSVSYATLAISGPSALSTWEMDNTDPPSGTHRVHVVKVRNCKGSDSAHTLCPHCQGKRVHMQ